MFRRRAHRAAVAFTNFLQLEGRGAGDGRALDVVARQRGHHVAGVDRRVAVRPVGAVLFDHTVAALPAVAAHVGTAVGRRAGGLAFQLEERIGTYGGDRSYGERGKELHDVWLVLQYR